MEYLKWGCARFVYLLLLPLCLMMMMNAFEFCYGGITSSYVRDKNLSLDMPLHSDVFTVPAGYNAPQQVPFSFYNFMQFLCIFPCFVTNKGGY